MPTTSRSCTCGTLAATKVLVAAVRRRRHRYARRMSDNPYRLPRTASPTRYDLVLEPDLDAATFRGAVEVALDVHTTADELVCNAAELEIDRAWVTTVDGQRL